MNITTNYIRLNTDPEKGVFEYEVRFKPEIHTLNLRQRLLHQHRHIIGNVKTFDGTTLYLPIKLDDNVIQFTAINENDNASIEVKVNYKRQKQLRECIHLYNVLFGRIMKTLKMVKFGRKQFDPTAPLLIPQHKLEVWPGFVTAVNEYDGGVMLCLDVSHRVLCQTTCLDLLRNAYRSDATNFQRNAATALIGAVVLTGFNNKTYRIDDIDFERCPMDTFTMNDGTEVSYVDYYKSQHNKDIRDVKQPMLISVAERRIIGQKEKEPITLYLVPELCCLTGLTDNMRSDFKVMRDIAAHTRVTPNQRLNSFKNFCQNVNTVPEAKEILANWGLSLELIPFNIQGRQLEEEQIIFAKTKCMAGINADFNRHVTANEVLEAVNIHNWLVIHTKNDTKYARSFMECMERNARPMGITVSKPNVYVLDMDKTELYVQALRRLVNPQLQIVVIICPTSRDDRYAAIKKVCCAELPIPSQIINGKTLSNDIKIRAIVQKIALQMNCKLGGTLWAIKIPLKNTMICGIDTYHDSTKKENSVSAFVASLNPTYTRWYSRAIIQKQKEELVNGLCASLVASLQEFKKMNDILPDRIIIFRFGVKCRVLVNKLTRFFFFFYRDGVGDGQLIMCNEYEIPQLKNACLALDSNYKPELTFIVVQKRINTRFFAVIYLLFFIY